jgi:hypothetical protein
MTAADSQAEGITPPTQAKFQRTSFLSPRLMAESALSLNIKIAAAPAVHRVATRAAAGGWSSTSPELNSTARNKQRQRRSARAIISQRFARFVRQTDDVGDETPL